jgi:hypothetical protein
VREGREQRLKESEGSEDPERETLWALVTGRVSGL